MSGSIEPVFYGLVCAKALWLALLWGGARWLGDCNRGMKVAFGAVTVFSLFVPVGGLPVWSWAFSFCPNPSLPMIGIVSAALWQHLFGVAVFKRTDWRATWIFGAVAGTVLYLHPLFLGSLDLYYWGWDGKVAIWGLAGLAMLFLLGGNRLGVLFLAALIGFELRALESRNGWDYLIDPFYWIVSVGVVGADLMRSWRAGRMGRRTASPIEEAPATKEAAATAMIAERP